jgi:hypothetical protein
MGYIGNSLSQQVTQPATQFFNGNGSTTSFTLNQTPQSVYTVEVVVNNVQQHPQTSYYINGNTLIFYSPPSSGSNNIYVNYDPVISYTSQPGYGTVGNNQLGSITNINSVASSLTLQTNGITAVTINQSQTVTVGGALLPATDNSYNLGSTSNRWANIYTGDLHLSNESHDLGNVVDGTKGNWTIQEGDENLYIVNNKTGKHYRIKLEEV